MPALRTANLWHLTGITPALSPSCLALARAALDVARRADGSRPAISFDVNYRPALWDEPPGDLLRELADAADIVFVGLDEAAALWGAAVREPADVRALLPNPAHRRRQGRRSRRHGLPPAAPRMCPSLRVEVVEPVGAGDAFAAGFLAALLAPGTPCAACAAGT